MQSINDMLQKGVSRQHNPQLFDRKSRVILVGNGPVSGYHGHEIDKYDVVVRFNKYSKDTKAVGEKMDLHVLHVNQNWQAFHDPSVLTIPMECDKIEENYASLPSSFHPIHRDIWKETCALADSSRGFLCFLFLRRLFSHLDLIGFSGTGHHDPTSDWKQLHNVDVEHEMLKHGELNS
jgi:hypothetical protein